MSFRVHQQQYQHNDDLSAVLACIHSSWIVEGQIEGYTRKDRC